MSEYESTLLQTEALRRKPSAADNDCQFYKRVLLVVVGLAVTIWAVTITVLVIDLKHKID